jgi:hypothetical protein
MTNRTKKTDYGWAGPKASVGEPSFIPRSENAPDGDGYLVTLVSNFGTNLSSFVVLDTANLKKEIAMVYPPFRIRTGFHGNWINSSEMSKPGNSLVDMTWVPDKYNGSVDDKIRGPPTNLVSF